MIVAFDRGNITHTQQDITTLFDFLDFLRVFLILSDLRDCGLTFLFALFRETLLNTKDQPKQALIGMLT